MFKTYFQKSAVEVDQKIDLVLNKWVEEVKNTNQKLVPLIDLFVQSCQGGKRLRGVLVKLGYEIGQSSVVGRQSSDSLEADSYGSILHVAAAYEIFQTAILIHDDVIDQSSTRRGKQTVYRALGGNHYGISQAIGLGDAGFFLAVKLISETNFQVDVKNHAITFFSDVMVKTALGEMLDVELPHLGQRTQEDVLTIHKLKTAYYTISGPLILGAILAGANKQLLDQLEEFGENLGIAFQIQDDILGVFGDEEELGKSTTSDIEEGKNTLLITEGLNRATPEQRIFLEKNYGRGETGVIGEIREIFIKTGALEYSQKMAEKYADEAKKLIPTITKNLEFSRILEQMGEYLVERTK